MTTQKDYQLLLKDLCARLPYGVKLLHETWNYEWDDSMSIRCRVTGIDEKWIYVNYIDSQTDEEYKEGKIFIETFDDKLFLRPMSSMTEEEESELMDIADIDYIDSKVIDFGEFQIDKIMDVIDYLNAHHFDYRGLIRKKLAIDCTGMDIYN